MAMIRKFFITLVGTALWVLLSFGVEEVCRTKVSAVVGLLAFAGMLLGLIVFDCIRVMMIRRKNRRSGFPLTSLLWAVWGWLGLFLLSQFHEKWDPALGTTLAFLLLAAVSTIYLLFAVVRSISERRQPDHPKN